MMNGKLQVLSRSLRPAGGRLLRTKATAPNSHVLEEISRECTAVSNVLRLRAKEQTVETLLRHNVYQEMTEPFEKLKDVCRTPPSKKKKSSKRSRKRAAELLTELVRASPTKTEKPTAVGDKIAVSAAQILARSEFKPSPDRRHRRRSFVLFFGTRQDLLSPACCERSARSFISETSRGVEAS